MNAVSQEFPHLPPAPISDQGDRPIIQLEAGQLHVYADRTERLVSDLLYVRGQQLVRLGLAPELKATKATQIQRDNEQYVIVPVNAEYLRRKLNSLADFQKYSHVRHTSETVNCPMDLVRNILEAGDSKHFAPLEAVSTSPFLRADLSICDMPGYDATSRVYYAPNAEFPPIPETPNKDDAEGALERLLEPFSEFPFATDDTRAAFASHILAAVARHAIDTRPVYTYTAPIAATGKTLLATMASRIADGIKPGIRPYTDDSEEIRKVLMAALLAGDSALHLDNVPSGAKVRSSIICSFVTADTYSDRKLGVSESPTLTNRCGIVLTGNNVSPVGDLARRCLIVRLDADAETARGREFKITDLKAYVTLSRPQLLVDALTVIRAYALASDPVKVKPLESFEQWSRIARDPLVWLGYGDAVKTQQLEADDEIGPLREAFAYLAVRMNGKEFGAADITRICSGYDGETLKALIESAGCSDATSPKHIGYWLREHRDQVAGSYKLVHLGITHGSARWKLRGL